ncbi:dnaJ homolog subfamily C member 17 [Synchiropus picturatus]
MAKKLTDMDLYGLLGVESTASTKQIKKAFRQKALTCHPDKNPDNPKAAELFHQLSEALELLTDAAARASYDKICTAKKQAEERTKKLDSKRKKMKLDLEERERQAELEKQNEMASVRQQQEIIRLREEGQRLLEEEQSRREQMLKESSRVETSSDPNTTPKLKLKWKCKKGDETNGGYSQDVLFRILQKYGDVLHVIVSSHKRGSGLVEFASVKAAERAVQYEKGLTENPLKISWVSGKPEAAAPSSFKSTQSTLVNERDYESLVLMKMRQAAERQRLIEEMQKEDEEES